MKPRPSRSPEALAVLLAGALLGASAWTFRPRAAGDDTSPRVESASPRWEPALPARSVAAPAAWRKPSPQSSGAGWVYEIFTPPAVYYNRVARSFSVTPPGARGEGAAAFGLELLAVRQELFRLQLSGYFGEEGNWLAAFTVPGSPETLLARPGRSFAGLGLRLRDFAVRRVEVGRVGGQPVHEVAGFAVLVDERSGAEVILDSRTRAFTADYVAVVRSAPAEPGEVREVREGDTLSGGGVTYRIERIQGNPPEVVVSRREPGLPVPETVILRPVPAAPGGVASRRELSPTPPPSEAVTRH